MKKLFIYITLIIIIFSACCFSACNTNLNNNKTKKEYIKLSDTIYCKDTSIKSTSKYYTINLSGFNYTKLSYDGYRMTISVDYKYYYVKDWDVIWDLGYLGAPKLTTAIKYGSDEFHQDHLESNYIEDLKTNIKNGFISCNIDPIKLADNNLYLYFSTTNIQNIIHIKDIKVQINCYK